MSNSGKTAATRCLTLRRRVSAFTILEMLVATAVLTVMVGILFELFSQGSNAWTLGERRADQYQGNRITIDLLQRELSLAVIDTNAVVSGMPPTGQTIYIKNSKVSPASKGYYYSDLSFLAPTDLGNGMTNSAAAYRPVCGVRYYLSVPTTTTGSGNRPVLPSLYRQVFRTNAKAPRPNTFGLYDREWFRSVSDGDGAGAGYEYKSSLIVDNVFTFRVRSVEYQGAGAFRVLDTVADRGKITGMRIDIAVADRRTASRINQIGTGWPSTAGIQAVTNSSLVYIRRFDRVD